MMFFAVILVILNITVLCKSQVIAPNDFNVTHPPTSYNDIAVIYDFHTSLPIIVGDDFSLNCTPGLTTGQMLVSLTISKDNVVFYNYSDNKVQKSHNVTGITIFQIVPTKDTIGSVIIKAVPLKASGIYECKLNILTANGSPNSTSRALNITVSDTWSPWIHRFDVPNVIALGDDYWINCTYGPKHTETLVALNLSKDGETFYSHSGGKTHVTEFHSQINAFMITLSKEIGCVKMRSAIPSYKGIYECSVTAQRQNGTNIIDGTTTKETYVEFIAEKNPYSMHFDAPSKFGNSDDHLLNCSLTLEAGVKLSSMSISKDDKLLYTYQSSTGKCFSTKPLSYDFNLAEVHILPGIPDTKHIQSNAKDIGVVTILYATRELSGSYMCDANITANTRTLHESVTKYVDYTDDWKPDIYRFYVPDSVKRGDSDYWVNCSLAGLTKEEMSQFLLEMSKDMAVFYNISHDSKANTYPVRGLEHYQYDITGQHNGSVRIKGPTVEAKGLYRCSLTTTRSGESKTVYKEYLMDYISSASDGLYKTAMYFIILIAVYFNF